MVNRGYHQAQELIASADRGVGVVVRYNPHSMNLYDEAETQIDGYEELQKMAETERCVPVPG